MMHQAWLPHYSRSSGHWHPHITAQTKLPLHCWGLANTFPNRWSGACNPAGFQLFLSWHFEDRDRGSSSETELPYSFCRQIPLPAPHTPSPLPSGWQRSTEGNEMCRRAISASFLVRLSRAINAALYLLSTRSMPSFLQMLIY